MRRIAQLTASLFLASLAVTNGMASEIQSRHGLSLFDSLKYKKDFKYLDYVNPNAPKGGSITLPALGGFDNFNPYNGKGEVVSGASLMYYYLLERAYDEPGSEYGLIAQAVRHAPDYSWVEYDIHPKAKFSDGEPIKPSDIIYSFNLLTEKGDPLYRFYYKNVSEVKQIGDKTVRFIFDTPGNRELPLITGQLPILPEHYWKDHDFTKVSLDIPVTSGQYRIKSFDPNRSVTYERDPNHWTKDLPNRQGVNNFDTLRYEYYRDALVAFEAFKAGEFDYYQETSAKNWKTGYDFDAFKQGKIKKEEFYDLNPKPFQGMVYNLRRPIFQDKVLREALELVFDFDWLNKNLFYNSYAETDSYFEKSEMEALGKPAGRELEIIKKYQDIMPPEILTQDLGHKKCLDYRHCSRTARMMLQKAGYRFDNGALISPQGKPVTFEILNNSPLMERVLLPVIDNMSKIGVKATLRTLDPAQYIRRLNAFDYDMVVGLWAQSPSPGNEQREYWGSASADRQASRNYSGLKEKSVDAIIEHLIYAKSREELVASVKVLDRLLRHYQFAIPMWHAPANRIAYWDKFEHPHYKGDSYGINDKIIFWWRKE